jgi:hypothetical protein
MKTLLLILASFAAFGQTTTYPGAIDTNASLFVTGDNLQTTLSAAMTTGDSAAVVASATGITANMIVTVCDTFTTVGSGSNNTATKCTAFEHMLVTAVNGNILTVTRGVAGTSARAHVSGRLISVLIDSAHVKVLKDAVIAIETALGPNLANVPTSPLLSSSQYDFAAQTPGGSLSVGSNVITMTPCPLGVNGTNTSYTMYLSGGTGTAEAALLTGGTCTSGAATGTVILTCANTHSGAWTIQSAASGIPEAIWAAPNFATVFVPAGAWPVYGTITKPATKIVSIRGEGSGASLLQAFFAAGHTIYFDAGYVGYQYQGVSGLRFVAGIARTSGSDLYAVNAQYADFSDLYAANGYTAYTFENFVSTTARGLRASNMSRYGLELKCTAAACGGVFSDILLGMGAASPAAAIVTAGAGSFAGMLWDNVVLQGGAYNLYVDPLGGIINEFQISNLQVDSATTTAVALTSSVGGSANGFSISNVRVSPASGGGAFYVGKAYSNVAISDVTGAKVGNVSSVIIDGATNVSLQNVSIVGGNNAGGGDVGLLITDAAGQVTTNVSVDNCHFGEQNPPNSGLTVSAAAHVGLRIASSTFFGTVPASDSNTNKTLYQNVVFGTSTTALQSLMNYIGTTGGVNNAITGTLTGAVVQSGLCVTVQLAHSLQSGANTFALNGGAAVAIKKATDPTADLGTALTTSGLINLCYRATGPAWLATGQ